MSRLSLPGCARASRARVAEFVSHRIDRSVIVGLLASAVTSALTAGAAQAQTASEVVLPTINVTAEQDSLGLNVPNYTGSRLGLTPRETPATVDIVTDKEIEERGLRSLVETYDSVPGVTAGNNPGEPGVVTMRGFNKAATYTVDGARIPDAFLTSRDYDTFNFERVEIVRGPASVTQGTGALSGTINVVTKQPQLGKTSVEGLASYGSFNSTRAGIGANVALAPNAAIRSTVSYSKSDGWIDDTKSEKYAITNNVLVEANDRLTFTGAVNYFHDDFRTAYQGTPLVPANVARDPSDVVTTTNGYVLDKALGDKNYDVYDGVMKSDAVWLRGGFDYKLTGHWTLKNELNFYHADRLWAGADTFTYNTATGKFDRATTMITHDHQFWSDRAAVSYDGPLGRFRNRFTTGLEYVDTVFNSKRRFGTTTSVDLYDPDRGYFPPDTAANFPTRVNFDSTLTTLAGFAENALNITPGWIVVAGARYERIVLDRSIYDLNAGTTTSFDKTFYSPTWRIGTVYDILPGTSLYAQYTQAAIPVSTLLLANTTNGTFELSTGQSVEGGIKSSLWNDRVMATAAIYQIDQDNILTRDPVTPTLTVQGGSQRSRGVELSAVIAVTTQWSVTTAYSYVDAYYTSLRNGTQDLAGNRPINVPAHTFSLSTSYRLASIPLTVGVGLKNVGSFYTDTTNSIEVKGHTVYDAWLAYDLPKGTLRLRGRNLTNEYYAEWSGYSSTQVYLGAPRSVDLSYSVKW